MAYDFIKVKRDFEREFKKEIPLWRAAGFTEEQIAKEHDDYYEQIKRDRAYDEKARSLDSFGGDEEHGIDNSPLVRMFTEQFIEMEAYGAGERFDWLHSLEDTRLGAIMDICSEDEAELLTLIFFEGYTQTEMARRREVSCAAISKRLGQIYQKIRSME